MMYHVVPNYLSIPTPELPPAESRMIRETLQKKNAFLSPSMRYPWNFEGYDNGDASA